MIVFGVQCLIVDTVLAGNEANDVMPTPAPAPAPGSKPSHRSRARPSTNKRQAPRIHVSGSRGSMHGICEVGYTCILLARLTILSLRLSLSSFVTPNQRSNAPNTAVTRVQTMPQHCAR